MVAVFAERAVVSRVLRNTDVANMIQVVQGELRQADFKDLGNGMHWTKPPPPMTIRWTGRAAYIVKISAAARECAPALRRAGTMPKEPGGRKGDGEGEGQREAVRSSRLTDVPERACGSIHGEKKVAEGARAAVAEDDESAAYDVRACRTKRGAPVVGQPAGALHHLWLPAAAAPVAPVCARFRPFLLCCGGIRQGGGNAVRRLSIHVYWN